MASCRVFLDPYHKRASGPPHWPTYTCSLPVAMRCRREKTCRKLDLPAPLEPMSTLRLPRARSHSLMDLNPRTHILETAGFFMRASFLHWLSSYKAFSLSLRFPCSGLHLCCQCGWQSLRGAFPNNECRGSLVGSSGLSVPKARTKGKRYRARCFPGIVLSVLLPGCCLSMPRETGMQVQYFVLSYCIVFVLLCVFMNIINDSSAAIVPCFVP